MVLNNRDYCIAIMSIYLNILASQLLPGLVIPCSSVAVDRYNRELLPLRLQQSYCIDYSSLAVVYLPTVGSANTELRDCC